MKPSSSPSDEPHEDFSAELEVLQKLRQLFTQLDLEGFPIPEVISVQPIKIKLPYKNGVNYTESRQVLTRILDSNFFNWSCSTEYEGQNYLISG